MGNLAIAVTKFTAAAFTGSAAMISEGMHPLVDTGNCLLLLCGCLQEQQAARHGTSLRPWTRDLFLDADRRDHDLRRRRRFRYEGILHALHPRPITNITWNYAVQCLAAAFESMFLSHYANSRRSRDHIRYGRRYRPSTDPTLFAAPLGLLAAFLGIHLGHRLNNHISTRQPPC